LAAITESSAAELAHGGERLLRVDASLGIDAQARDAVAGALGGRGRLEHRRVLDRRRHQRGAGTGRAQAAEQRQVVGLGPAGGEQHFILVHPERGGDAFARLVEQRARGASGRVHAGGVAAAALERLGEVRAHLRAHRGRGVVVEVDALHVRRSSSRYSDSYCSTT
jgi:hypothetical protein